MQRQEQQQHQKTTLSTKRVAKVIETIGTPEERWEAAARRAIEEARRAIRGIHAARINPNSGRVIEYRTGIHLSLGFIDEEIEQQQQ